MITVKVETSTKKEEQLFTYEDMLADVGGVYEYAGNVNETGLVRPIGTESVYYVVLTDKTVMMVWTESNFITSYDGEYHKDTYRFKKIDAEVSLNIIKY